MRKILIILTCLIILTGCSNDTNNNSNSNKEKLGSEIDYISSQIADMLHNLNNISLENYELKSEKISLSSDEQSGSSQESSVSEGNSRGGRSTIFSRRW